MKIEVGTRIKFPQSFPFFWQWNYATVRFIGNEKYFVEFNDGSEGAFCRCSFWEVREEAVNK